MDNNAAILSALAYFDLFHYPVTEREIHFFLPGFVPPHAYEHSLDALLEDGMIYSWDGFYTVRDDQHLIHRRLQGNAKAARMLVTAEKVAALISRFPYVRGVGVSGSLSKQFADQGADIDLFIITAPDRLWIARTLLHMLKKLSFLVGRQDWFCMNYFVDEAALEIPEKNMYTAVEVVTLLPMRGTKAFADFGAANRWTENWLPNSHGRFILSKDDRPSFLKRMLERIGNNAAGDRVDRWLMKVTARRWHRKTMAGAVNSRGILMSMDATRHWARPDPSSYQTALLEAFEQRKAMLLHRYERLHPQEKTGLS